MKAVHILFLALLSALAVVVALLIPRPSPAPEEAPDTTASAPPVSETAAPVSQTVQSDGGLDRLVLVNSRHPWTGDTPQGLGTIAQLIPCRNIRLKSNEMRAQSEAVLALQEMADAMAQEGVGEIRVVSAYRSVEYQDQLFQNKVQRVLASGVPSANAQQVAAQEVNRPGDSEHHTGYAFDLAGADNALDSFAGSNQERWIRENGPRFGFVIRYPSDKTDITGIIHEPWHIRYVGVEAALEMQARGQCLEEYLGG